jgi:hypothetical protein
MVYPKNVTPDAQRIRMKFCLKKTINMEERNAIYCKVNPKIVTPEQQKRGASET